MNYSYSRFRFGYYIELFSGIFYSVILSLSSVSNAWNGSSEVLVIYFGTAALTMPELNYSGEHSEVDYLMGDRQRSPTAFCNFFLNYVDFGSVYFFDFT